MKYDKNNPLQGFHFYPIASGAYLVHYQSDYDSRVGRHYEARIEDMTIIDATKNAQDVKKCDVDHLRRLVKAGRCVKY